MRRLTLLVLILAAIYAGYWVIGARAVENAAQTAVADLAAQGWDIGETQVNTRGFPNRFDTTLREVDLTTPLGDIRYTTDFVQAFALSYRPNRVIMAVAPKQTITLPEVTITLESNGLKASAGVAANADLTFDDFTAEATDLTLNTDLGWGVTVGQSLLAMRYAGPGANTYDLYLTLPDIVLPSVSGTPEPISVLTVDATAQLDQPLDRHVNAPAVNEMTLNELAVDWAGATLRGSGVLVPDAQGFASGQIDLTITDHAVLLDQLGRAGAIDPGVVPTWRNMADAMAGGADVLTLPVVFNNGRVSMGLFGLGPAPMMR